MKNNEKKVWRGQYSNPKPIEPIDLSNQYEDTFIELAPYARNEKGEFLNDSPYPKLVPGEKVNIQERIDSFFEDVDLYSLLAKVGATGDTSYLDKKRGFYSDVSNIPNNYNEINSYYKNLASSFSKLPDPIKEMIKNGESIEKVFEEIDKISKENNSASKEDSSASPEASKQIEQEGEK